MLGIYLFVIRVKINFTFEDLFKKLRVVLHLGATYLIMFTKPQFGWHVA
jgi:hypothetical protein